MTEHILITGHSSGLGLALANDWLARGATVQGLARRSAATLAQHYPNTFTQTSIDLSQTDALINWTQSDNFHDFCQTASRLWLFNNAGTQTPANILGKQDPHAITNAINLNISAPLILANALAAQINSRIALNIVHISSGAAQNLYPGWSLYAASKAALNQHARTIAEEQQPQLKIIALAPGVIDTAMQTEIRENTTFPSRERFLALKENNALQTADSTAKRIIDYCLSDDFGKQTLVDIRYL